jgi:hypothetical protein
MMAVSSASRVSVPSGVLVSKAGEETVLLNLDSERYFGLDPVGTRMWEVLGAQGKVGSAYETLLAEFDADPEQLRRDLYELIEKLREHGLVEVVDE